MVIVNLEGNKLKTSGLYLNRGHNGGCSYGKFIQPDGIM